MQPHKRTTPKITSAESKELSRRSLLKGMGVGVAGLAASALGTDALASTLGLPAGTQPDLLWDYTVPGNVTVFRPPIYYNGTVVLNLRDPGLNSNFLRAVDIQTQQVLWSVQMPNQYVFSLTFGDAFLGGLFGAAPTLYVRTDAGMLMAINFSSGKILWQKSYEFDGPITVMDGQLMIVITTSAGDITALNSADGSVRWTCQTGQPGTTPTAVMPFKGQFYVALNGRLFGVDPSLGALTKEIWIGGQVYGPLTADSKYIYCTDGDLTLFAVDTQSATKAWSWKSNAQLSAPIAYCGRIYLVAQNGLFQAIDPVQQKPVWSTAINPFSEFNPLFIEDGVAYVTCIDASDSKLFAIDLPTSGGEVVSTDLGRLGKVFGVENGIVYFSHYEGKSVGAKKVPDQIHEFFCESELMADNYVKGSNGNAMGSTPTFRTHVQLFDINKNPRANKSVKLTTSGPLTITSNGNTQQVDTNIPMWVTTDGAGEFSIVSQATTISSPAIYLWGNFMDALEAIVIYPDHETLNTLSQVTADALTKAKPFDGSPLMPSELKDTSGLASAIRSTIGGAAQAIQLTRQRQVKLAAAAGRAAQTVSISGHRRKRQLKTDPTSYIAFPDSTPNMLFQPTLGSANRTYVPGAIKNWQATFGPGGVMFTPTTAATAHGQLLGDGWDDFWSDVVNGVRKIVSVIVSAAEEIVHLITDDLGNLYKITIDSLEKAVSIVAGFFKTIVDDLEKAVEWLSFLFDWSNILKVKDDLKGVFQGGFNNLETWLNANSKASISAIHGFFTDLEGDIEGLLQSPPSGAMQSFQKNGNNPQSVYGHGGAKSYTKTRWMTDKLQNNARNGSFSASAASGSPDSLAGVAAEAVAAFANFFTDVKDKLATSNFKNIPDDISKVFNDVALLFQNPSNFATHALADITVLLVDVAVAILQLVDALVESALTLITAMVKVILDFLTVPINIPVISDLWALISGDPLSILDVCCLIAAIPTSILLQFVKLSGASAGLGDPVDLTSNVGYVTVAALYSILDALNDLIGEPSVPLIAGAGLALGVIQMGLGFPTDLANNNAASYVVYALQVLPMVGTLGTVLPTPLQPVIGAVLPQALSLYGFTAFFLAIGLGAKYPKQFPLLTELANIFASIPYIAKPLSNGENPVTKVALAAIDGVCDLTVVGLGIAEWA